MTGKNLRTIVFVSETFNPDSGWGGVASALAHQAEQNGYRVIKIASDESGSQGVPRVFSLEHGLTKRFIKAWAWRKWIKSNKFDLIHFVTEPHFWLSVFTDIPCIGSVHGTYALPEAHGNFIKRSLFAKGMDRLDVITAVSGFTLDQISPRWKSKVRVIPNGIDLSIINEPHVKAPWEVGKGPRLLTVGAVKPRKGIVELVRGLAEMKKTQPDAVLAIVGKAKPGQYVDEVKRCISEHQLDGSVYWAGKVSRAELLGWYRWCDMFALLPIRTGSSFDGFGLVYLEANALGKPCLGLKNTASEQAISPDTGALAESSEPSAIADAANRIVAGKFKFDGWVKEHEWKQIFSKYDKVYSQTMNEASGYEKIDFALGRKSFSGHFTPLELRHLRLLDPVFYAHVQPEQAKNENQEYFLDAMQAIFNGLLRRYLKIKDEVSGVAILRSEMEKYFFLRSFLRQDKLEPDNLDASTIIKLIYDDLKELNAFRIGKGQVLDIKIPQTLEQLSATGWQYGCIAQIGEKAKKLKGIKTLALHGSFATQDYLKGWSDLDLALVLDESALQSPASLRELKVKLQKLAKSFYRIDPLAHHEFNIVLTPLDVSLFSRSLFAPVIFENAVLLSGSQELKVNLRGDETEKLRAIWRMTSFFRRKTIAKKYSQKKFDWKNDLSQIMLLPSLLLEAKGIFVYKKQSFGLAKETFGQIDFRAVDQASAIRLSWSQSNINRFLPLKWDWQVRLGRFFNSKILQSEREVKSQTDSAERLLTKSLEYFLKTYDA